MYAKYKLHSYFNENELSIKQLLNNDGSTDIILQHVREIEKLSNQRLKNLIYESWSPGLDNRLIRDPYLVQIFPLFEERLLDWTLIGNNTGAVRLYVNKIIEEDGLPELSCNFGALQLLTARPDLIDWTGFSEQPWAIDVIRANYDKIRWRNLSSNDAALDLIMLRMEEENSSSFDKHTDNMLSLGFMNWNPACIPWLRANPDKIIWECFKFNPNSIEILQHNQIHIDTEVLSRQATAMDFLIKLPQYIDWHNIMDNPRIMELIDVILNNTHNWQLHYYEQKMQDSIKKIIDKNLDNDDFDTLIKNPAIFKLDYQGASIERVKIFGDELMSRALAPERVARWQREGIDLSSI